MLTRLYEYWQNGQLAHSSRQSYTYDANNNMLTGLSEEWLNGQWMYYWRNTCTYDVNNNMLTNLWEDWHNGQWANNYRETYTYDVNNNILSELWEYWDDQLTYGGDKYTYTYDAQSNITSVWHYVWLNSSWIPKDIVDGYFGYILYDSSGNEYQFLDSWYNITFIRKLIVTGVDSNFGEVVETYSLSQNYPNPFNPTTTIKYSIPKLSFVTIKIYDVLGSEVTTLVNEEKSVGNYELTWNAANLSSGVYFYRFQAGSFVQTRKMILLK